jgi:hypothetical protein
MAPQRDTSLGLRGAGGWKRAVHAVMVLSLCLSYAGGQESSLATVADLEKEANSWRRKIKDVEGSIVKTDAAAAEEVLAFRSYLQTTAAHKARLSAQNDSLAQDVAASKARGDSLEKVLEDLRTGCFAADNRVEELRLTVLSSCGALKAMYDSLPPGSVKATVSALEFLQSELSSKTVTAGEALERLWQMMASLDDAESSNETYAGTSPVPAMGGQAHYVRIGLGYLAAVSEEGKTAYLWGREAGTEGGWRPVSDPEAKAALWDAVRIRDRKIVPRIVDLPFDHPLTVHSLDDVEKESRGGGR